MKATRILPLREYAADSSAQFYRVRFRTLELPAVRDALVIGKAAPITAETMMQTLRLVSTERFIEIPLVDDTVASIVVRDGLLRKLQASTVTNFVLERVKPYMSDTEVLRLDIEMEILLEGSV